VDARSAVLGAGYALAAPGGGAAIRARELSPARLRAWAAALAALHALPPPAELPLMPPADWVGLLPQPWPVDVGPLLAQAAGMWRSPPPPEGGASLCHGRWWLCHARFDGEALVGVEGWGAAGRGDPVSDVAGVLVGLVADGASAGVAEALAGSFAAAYAEAGGGALSGLGAWQVALTGVQLAGALAARGRGERGPKAAAVTVWAGLLGRLLTRPSA
jgi:hypothetical protein